MATEVATLGMYGAYPAVAAFGGHAAAFAAFAVPYLAVAAWLAGAPGGSASGSAGGPAAGHAAGWAAGYAVGERCWSAPATLVPIDQCGC